MSAASIYAEAKTVDCPYCGAVAGVRCNVKGTMWRTDSASRPHQARLDASARVRAAKEKK